jgi:hypothetical protein
MLFKEVSAVSSEKRKKIINKKGKLLIVEESGTCYEVFEMEIWKCRKTSSKWKKDK